MSCRPNKCCFCVSLRAGVITIACLWLLGDFSFLAWMSYVTYLCAKTLHSMVESGNPWGFILFGPFWVELIYDILYSMTVPLDIMLLVGAITGRPRLLNCWRVCYAVLYAVILLVTGIVLVLVGFAFTPYYSIPITASVLLHAGLTVYFWIVVRSYYYELRQQNSEGTPLSTAGKDYRTMSTPDVLSAQDTYFLQSGWHGYAAHGTASLHQLPTVTTMALP